MDKLINSPNFKILILFLNDIFLIFFLFLLSSLSLFTIEIYNINNLYLFSYILFFILFNVYSYKTRIFSSILYIRIIFSLSLYLIFLIILKYLSIINFNLQIIFFLYFYLISASIFSRIFYLEFYKILYNYNTDKKNCLIYGAGWAGINLSTQINNYNIIGFIDDDISKKSKKINNIKVFSKDKINQLVISKKIDLIFLAIANISYQRKNEIISFLSQFNIECKIIPTFEELISKNISLSDYKNVDISDLIQRNYTFNNKDIYNELFNKSIAVTGAGGSIGSEIMNQLLQYKPKLIIALDNSEFNLYKLEQNLLTLNNNSKVKIINKLCDIRNTELIENILNKYSIEYVFHTSAYKHVPILENNISEAITNNFLATVNLCNISSKINIKKFVYISSDKAVRPTNIMGATKRLSEIYIQSFYNDLAFKENKTKFSIVRFGNVIGSRGSVLPLFSDQIKKGGPVTITHKKIERFFMTIPESVGLVLETTTLVKNADIFVLDMGKPIKIIDLAKKIIHLSGFEVKDSNNPNGDIEIKIIGLRPGEKLYEELFIGDNIKQTSHKNIFKDEDKIENYKLISNTINDINELLKRNDLQEIPNIIRKIVDGEF